MWQVVYIATEEEARLINERLSSQGFLVKIESVDDGSYEIKVPESEVEEAYQILADFF
ncbi:MAG TPA: hypothetical protein VKY40_08115 [Halanaerobiales bacterium]|nr:hypothetical protein [Halanaerobiales bacterium]